MSAGHLQGLPTQLSRYRRIRYNQYSFPESVRISEQAKDILCCPG